MAAVIRNSKFVKRKTKTKPCNFAPSTKGEVAVRSAVEHTLIQEEEESFFEGAFASVEDIEDDKHSDAKRNLKGWTEAKNVQFQTSFKEDVESATSQAVLATNLCVSLSLIQGTKSLDRQVYLDCVGHLHTLVHNPSIIIKICLTS